VDVAAYAKGYLGLIQANNRGTGLSLAADYLQPVVEIRDMLSLAERQVIIYSNLALPANAVSGDCFTVPVGEAWIVRSGGMILFAGAGNDITAHLTARMPRNIGGVEDAVVTRSGRCVGAGAATQRVAEPWAFPGMILASGKIIAFEGVTAAINAGIRVSLAYDRLTA